MSSPLVICVGTERWLQEEAIRELVASGVAPGAEALDLVTLTGEAATPEAILAAARTAPLASPRRLVVVRDLPSQAEEAVAWLTRYAQSPTPTTCLIVVLGTPPTGALRAALAGVAREIPCQPLKGGAVAAWIRQRMTRQSRKTLTPDAAQALVTRVGADLSALASWLEQLALYVGPRGQVTADDVTALVGWSVEERVFAVVDAAIRRDRVTALRVTRRLLEEEGVAPEQLLGALGKHLRSLWQTGRLRREAVTAALQALVETDRRLKTGGGSGAALLEPCVWALAGGGELAQATA